MKVGIFICHCGINIAGVIDISKVKDSIKHFNHVYHVESNIYSCSAEGIKNLKDAIKKNNLERVVVASCTPRTHEHLFRSACQEAGLNQYLFEFVNIREQCSWVHINEPEKATEKAIELIKMGVAKAVLLNPLEEKEVEIQPSVMIIGAGVAGITSALTLSKQGFEVFLVEKEMKVGGVLNELKTLFPTDGDASKLLELYNNKLKKDKNIKLLVSSTVKSVEGSIGNYNVVIERRGIEFSFVVGTIIVATGAIEFKPKGLYGYGEYENVLTQLEFEKIVSNNKPKPYKNIVMIQCVGSKRSEDIQYCSRICCVVAIKNSVLLKKICPNVNVYILYSDMQAHGPIYENYYKKAKERGIRFVNYDLQEPPKVEMRDGKLDVVVYNRILQEEMQIPCDLIVLSTPQIQRNDALNLSKMLSIPLGSDNFFLEAHIKLRPAEFMSEGIYLCGAAHAPKDINETVINALAAASKAAIPMKKKKIKIEPIIAKVEENICCGCGICIDVCPYKAIELDQVKGEAKVLDVKCKGCGVCSSACPSAAVQVNSYTDNQIIAMIVNTLG